MTRRRCNFFVILGLALGVLGLPAGVSGEEQAQSRAGIRALTPEEVKKRLEEEEAKINAEPPIEGLPPRLSYYLRTRLPEMAVLARDFATEENLRFAVSGLRQPSPFICLGDFDGDGFEDATVIMREKATGRLILMAFHQSTLIHYSPGDFTRREYAAYRITELGSAAPGTKFDGLVIICNKPGQFESVSGEVKVILRNHSITVGWSVLYYFAAGTGYQSLLISEAD